MTQVWAWCGDGGRAARLVGLGLVSMLLSRGRALAIGHRTFWQCPP